MGDGQFVDISRATGSDEIKDSRAVAIADLDGNGKLDMVIANNNAAPTIYLNQLESAGHWVALDLVGEQSNRNAVGAVVVLKAGGKTMHRVVKAGSGYASQAPLSLHIGLGAATRIDALQVTWPNGRVDTFKDEDLNTHIDCRLSLREGSGQLVLCGRHEVGRATPIEERVIGSGGAQP